jgi:hypothetical protein
MRAREFLPESATTTAGSVATVAVPLGTVQSRNPVVKPGKYPDIPVYRPTRKKYNAS